MRAWPTVERPHLLERVTTERAIGTRIVVVTGGAGTGKTTLAEQIAGAMAADGGSERDAVRLMGDPSGLWLAGAGTPQRLTDLPEAAVLLVDDAHELDPESANWLSLTLAFSDRVAVLTIRDDSALPRGLERLVVMDGCLTLAVPPLTENEAHDLLRTALGEPISRHTSHAAWRLSEGSPFVLRELVRSHGDELRAGRVDGLLRGEEASPAMAVLVRNQVDRLDDRTRDALDTLSVARELSLPVAAACFGADRVRELERSGFVVVERRDDDPVDTLRFRHRWFQEAIRNALAGYAYRAHAAALRDAYDNAVERSDRDVVLAAFYAVESDGEIDLADLRRAVALAVEGEEWAMAVPLARRAAALDDRWMSSLGLVQVLIALRTEAALTEARAIVIDLRRGPWAAVVHDFTTPFLAVIEILLGHREAAEALLLPAIEPGIEPGTEPGTEPVGDDAGATEARAGARAVYDLFFVSPRTAALALRPFSAPASGRVRLLAAAIAGDIGLAEGALPSGEDSFGTTLAALYDGAADRANRNAYASFLATLDTPSVNARLGFALQAGLSQQVQGHFRSAADWFTTVISSECRSMDCLFAYAGVAECAYVLGRPDWLVEAADQLSARYVEFGSPLMAENLKRRTDALCLSLRPGNVRKVRQLLSEGAHLLHDHDYLLFEADLLLMAAKLGVADLDIATRHEQVARRLGSAVVVQHATASRSHVQGDWAALLAACKTLAELGNVFGSVVLSARGAEAAERAGVPSAARQLAIHANELRARTDMSSAVNGASTAGRLAVREREVARHAADGRSSKEIAQRLDLSRKTVDNTLSRAYRKLGVSSRAELRTLLASDAGALETS